MVEELPEDWRAVLEPALATAETEALAAWLAGEEATGKTVYPPREERFAALRVTSLADVRVVILGQDPYHGPGQAHGLAFSVPDGVKLPPSLRNIYRELADDLGIETPTGGNLTGWAKQGVLLLNTTLTVEAGEAGSHARQGWERVTDAVVAAVAAKPEPCVFILWGAHAQKKAARVLKREGRHLIVSSPHPSPLSAYRGFFGSRPFSRADTFLASRGRGRIDWQAE
ncbi:MAG: uracil-DNA glycosylase [Parerythrobacter sp.]